MTTVDALNGLKKFIEREVTSAIKLRKEGLTNEPTEFVHPYVSLISLPHKNFMQVNFQVPHILIGLADGTWDNSDEHSINIRMQFATYGGENTFKETANIPNSEGYIDLLNLMERTKERLVSAAVIEGCGTINKPISYGIYNEQITYPYWYGYLTFGMQLPITTRPMNDFL